MNNYRIAILTNLIMLFFRFFVGGTFAVIGIMHLFDMNAIISAIIFVGTLLILMFSGLVYLVVIFEFIITPIFIIIGVYSYFFT